MARVLGALTQRTTQGVPRVVTRTRPSAPTPDKFERALREAETLYLCSSFDFTEAKPPGGVRDLGRSCGGSSSVVSNVKQSLMRGMEKLGVQILDVSSDEASVDFKKKNDTIGYIIWIGKNINGVSVFLGAFLFQVSCVEGLTHYASLLCKTLAVLLELCVLSEGEIGQSKLAESLKVSIASSAVMFTFFFIRMPWVVLFSPCANCDDRCEILTPGFRCIVDKSFQASEQRGNVDAPLVSSPHVNEYW